MSKSSLWTAYYEGLPDGRWRMTRTNLTAFEARFPNRTMTVEFNLRPKTLLLLDRPYIVGERQTTYDAYYLIPVTGEDLSLKSRVILREKP